MSEASYLVELREGAPRAPEVLRELVRELPPTRPTRTMPPIRPLLVAGTGIAVAVAVGAAAISGIHGSGSSNQGARAVELRATRHFSPQIPDHGAATSKTYRRRPRPDRAEPASKPGRVDEHARQGPVRRDTERRPNDTPTWRLHRRRRLCDGHRGGQFATRLSASRSRTSRRRSRASRSSGRSSRSTSRSPTSKAELDRLDNANRNRPPRRPRAHRYTTPAPASSARPRGDVCQGLTPAHHDQTGRKTRGAKPVRPVLG